MKTKLLTTILAIVMIVSCMFTMTACGGISDWINDKTDQTQTDDTNNDTNDNDNDNDDDDNDNDDNDDIADLLAMSVSFAEDSWEIINAVSMSGQAQDYYSIGDEKVILVAAEPYTFRIIGFNHDDLADGSGKAGITLDMTTSMIEIYKYNNTNTNAGGWKESDARNDVLPYLFNLLESDVKEVVKTVNKRAVNASGGSEIETLQEKLFLLSANEVLSGSYPAEGSRYAYFADGGSRQKQRNGYSEHWFLRTPITSGVYVYAISYSGNAMTNGNANQSNIYLSFAFCV